MFKIKFQRKTYFLNEGYYTSIVFGSKLIAELTVFDLIEK